jgi:tripartite-type tricarboxylate transporter receptor subunit TctC
VKSLPYDPARDFTFITKIINGRAPLAIRADLKIDTLKQLVEAAKTRRFTYASMDPGSFPQLMMEEVNRVGGVKIAEVPYRSPVQGFQAFLTGEVDITNVGPAQALDLTKQGKVKLIGVTGRSPLFPDLPSFAESGFDTTILRTPLWFGILGPARLPPKIVDTTLAALKSAFEEEELKAFFRASGSEIVLNTPAEFEREYGVETAAVVPLIKALGITPQ